MQEFAFLLRKGASHADQLNVEEIKATVGGSSSSGTKFLSRVASLNKSIADRLAS